MLRRFLVKIKVLPAGLQKLVDSQLTSEDRMQICKQLVKENN
jgi:hypothetical protein